MSKSSRITPPAAPNSTEPALCRDVAEPADVELGLEGPGRNEPLLRHLAGYWPSVIAPMFRPAVRERILGAGRGTGEQLAIELHRTLGTSPDLVHAFAPDREDAGLRGVVLGAVLGLPAPQVGEGQVRLDRLGWSAG